MKCIACGSASVVPTHGGLYRCTRCGSRFAALAAPMSAEEIKISIAEKTRNPHKERVFVDAEKIKALRAQGMRYKYIQKALNISKTSVWRVLNNHGAYAND